MKRTFKLSDLIPLKLRKQERDVRLKNIGLYSLAGSGFDGKNMSLKVK